MEILKTKPYRIIVDFAHTPNAIEQVGKTVRDMTKGKLIHVFGSAGLRDASKRPMMGKNASRYADVIILTEEDYRTENVLEIISSIRKGISLSTPTYQFPDRREALKFSLSLAQSSDTVLVTGKGHEKSLCRGTEEVPWRDQEAIRKILKEVALRRHS
jgi:UDP-N-acetylmuramoyl-L-alanyl-D-glutamate--2,6-diaminopimelate ligase